MRTATRTITLAGLALALTACPFVRPKDDDTTDSGAGETTRRGSDPEAENKATETEGEAKPEV